MIGRPDGDGGLIDCDLLCHLCRRRIKKINGTKSKAGI